MWIWMEMIMSQKKTSDYDVEEPYIFQYPSREPFSADNGADDYNNNKKVELDVRYDNGWTDVNHAQTEVMAEASPYEIDAEIKYECNVEGYSH